MGTSDVVIELPSVDARALDALASRVSAVIAGLAGSPRLNAILGTEAGRELLELLDANRDPIRRQLAEGRGARGVEIRLRVWAPLGVAAEALAAVREVVDLVSDIGAVADAGGAPLDDADGTLLRRLLAHAEATVAAAGGAVAHVRFPAEPPADMLAVVEFWRSMDAQIRRLRETTALPRAAVTLPDEFDEIVADLWAMIHDQATEALERGDPLVEIRVPRTDKLRALAVWAAERMDLLQGLVRAGMVQREWDRPLAIIVAMFQAAVNQLAV